MYLHCPTPRPRPRLRAGELCSITMCGNVFTAATPRLMHISSVSIKVSMSGNVNEPYLREMYNWNCKVHLTLLTPSHKNNAYIVISLFCHLEMRYRNVGNESIFDIGNEGTDTSGVSNGLFTLLDTGIDKETDKNSLYRILMMCSY